MAKTPIALYGFQSQCPPIEKSRPSQASGAKAAGEKFCMRNHGVPASSGRTLEPLLKRNYFPSVITAKFF
jgi:hypothetical protein